LRYEVRVENPAIIFMFIFDLEIMQIENYDPISKLFKEGVSSEERVSERFYEPNYVKMIPPSLRINLPPIQIISPDKSSWNEIVERKGGLFLSFIKRGRLKLLKNVEIIPSIRIFNFGIVIVSFKLHLRGALNVDDVVVITNGLVDYNACIVIKQISGKGQKGPKSMSLLELAKEYVSRILRLLGKKPAIMLHPDTYTIILASNIYPTKQVANEYFSPPLNKYIYALSIRRIEDYKKINIRLAARTQKNIDFRENDICIISFRNTLLYLPGLGEELINNVYVIPIEIANAIAVKLRYFDLILFKELHELTPTALSFIEESIERLESLRIHVINVLTALERYQTARSFRVKRVLNRALEVLGVNEVIERIHRKIEGIDQLAGGLYNVQQFRRARQLELIFLLLAIVSLDIIWRWAIEPFIGGQLLLVRLILLSIVLLAITVSVIKIYKEDLKIIWSKIKQKVLRGGKNAREY